MKTEVESMWYCKGYVKGQEDLILELKKFLEEKEK